jgi:hypothetical protein
VKIIHWSMLNHSGMHHVAESMARAELAMGVESRLMDPFDKDQSGWEMALDADIHVAHTHIPEKMGTIPWRRAIVKPYKMVFPVHGTPEHFFENSVKEGVTNGYNAGVSYIHHQHGMQQADAIMSFVPRQQWLFDLATDKSTVVDLIPMGVDHAYWVGGASKGKYAGEPSVLTCENQHEFKWGVPIASVWQYVRREVDNAILHWSAIPLDLHRFVFPMLARYGSYGTVVGSWSYAADTLRDIFKSIDFYVSPVRYGDFNRLSMEASAAGAKVISFPGNDYADFWMHEGHHRAMADDLIRILSGQEPPRAEKKPAPTEADMARVTINVYNRVLGRPLVKWEDGETLPDAMPENVREAIMAGQQYDARPRTAKPITAEDL